MYPERRIAALVKYMSIYVARDEDTLGPYTSDEVIALLKTGILWADDLAAREGDAAWAPLSTFVPAGTVLDPVPVDHEVSAAPERRHLNKAALFATLGILLIVGVCLVKFWPAAAPLARPVVPRQTVSNRSAEIPLPSPPKPQAVFSVTPKRAVPSLVVTIPLLSTPSPTSAPLAEAAIPHDVSTPAPAAKACRLTGTISLAAPGGEPLKFAGVRVLAFSLESLQPLLAQNDARVQADLSRLEPQLKAAEAEKNARQEAAKSALQDSLDAAPSNPLYGALSFAAKQARMDVNTAQANYQYLLDQRAEAMDGNFYYRDLPAPLAESQTNPDGVYTLDLPAGGQYAVAARVSQTGIIGTQTHYWLVKTQLQDGVKASLPLTEHNAASSDSADTLMHTAN